MLTITRRKGYSMTFANGYRVSVQFGPGNYCDRSNADLTEPDEAKYWDSPNAEVAVINPKGDFVRLSAYDKTVGWKSPDEVAAIIAKVATDPESLAVRCDDEE